MTSNPPRKEDWPNFAAFLELNWLLAREWALLEFLQSGGEKTKSVDQSMPRLGKLLIYMLSRSVLLQITAMLDKEDSFGKDNLTLRRIFNEAQPYLDAKTIEDVNAHLLAIDQHLPELKAVRNKRLAHIDVLTHNGGAVWPQPRQEDVATVVEHFFAAIEIMHASLYGEEFLLRGIFEPSTQELVQASYDANWLFAVKSLVVCGLVADEDVVSLICHERNSLAWRKVLSEYKLPDDAWIEGIFPLPDTTSPDD